MRKLFFFCSVVIVISLIINMPAFGQSLTKSNALPLLQKQLGYPKIDFRRAFSIKADTALAQEINRLIKEKYLVPSHGEYIATEKGKNFIQRAQYNPHYKHYFILFAAYDENISKVTDLLVNSKEGVAEVEYEIELKPTDYLMKLKSLGLEKDAKPTDAGQPFDANFFKGRVFKQKTKMKRWDSGWRVAEH